MFVSVFETNLSPLLCVVFCVAGMAQAVQAVQAVGLEVAVSETSMIGSLFSWLEVGLQEVYQRVVSRVHGMLAWQTFAGDAAVLREHFSRRVQQRLIYIDSDDLSFKGMRRTSNITVASFQTLKYVLGNVENEDVVQFAGQLRNNRPLGVFWVRMNSMDAAARILGPAFVRGFPLEGHKAVFVSPVGRLDRLVGYDIMQDGEPPGDQLQEQEDRLVVIVRYDLDFVQVAVPDDEAPVENFFTSAGVELNARVRLGWINVSDLKWEGKGAGKKYQRPYICWRTSNGNLWCRFRVATITPDGCMNLA